MSETKVSGVSGIQFSSTVFPDASEMAAWNSLSPDERRAVIARDEEAGERSGIVPKETLDERLIRVRDAVDRAV